MLKRKYLVALIEDRGGYVSTLGATISKNLAEFWYIELGEQVGRDNIKTFNKHQDAVHYANEKNYEHLLVVNYGTDLEHNYPFINVLDDFIQDDDILIGHILDRKNHYYHLHEQCFYLNVKKAKEISNLILGEPGADLQMYKPVRSQESHHDGYTPLWLEKGTELESYDDVRFGYNIINSVLEAGYKIRSFGPEVRVGKYYFYPESEDTADKFAEWSEKHIFNKFYVYNTENLDPYNLQDNFKQPLSRMVTVSSGLNHLKIIKTLGYTDTFHLVFADYDKFALYAMEQIYARWNGKDYAGFINSINTQYFDGNFVAENFGDFNDEFLDFFGGEEAWIKWWIEYKNSIVHNFERINFLTCRLHNNPVKLINEFFSRGETDTSKILWLSNVFSYKQTSLYHSLIDRVRAQDYFMENLNQDISVFANYAVPWGEVGLTSVDYNKQEELAKKVLNDMNIRQDRAWQK
jgi:hypothetical protein